MKYISKSNIIEKDNDSILVSEPAIYLGKEAN